MSFDPYVAYCDDCPEPAIGGDSDGRLFCGDHAPETTEDVATDGGQVQLSGGFTACITVYRRDPREMTAIHRGLAPDITAGELLAPGDLGIDDWKRTATAGGCLFKRDTFGPLRSISDVGETDDNLPGTALRLTQMDGETITIRNGKLTECEAVGGVEQ